MSFLVPRVFIPFLAGGSDEGKEALFYVISVCICTLAMGANGACWVMLVRSCYMVSDHDLLALIMVLFLKIPACWFFDLF